MTEVNVNHSTTQGTVNYTSANRHYNDQECFKTENLSRGDCELTSKLVIVEPVSSEERSDESFQNESENSEILTYDNNGVSVGLIKSESQALCNSSLSIKLPLGRYEIAKVSKPQINLRATNLVSPVHKTDNNQVNFLNVVKPRSTPAREAVDPAKYYILNDEPDGTKYACSKCGNVYKWRKSLNKHWKEKHDGETPPSLAERERMLKCPPQNYAKHSTLPVTPAIPVGTKSILFPSTVSLASFKSTNQIRIPTSVYTLVNINKTAEVVVSRSQVNQSQTSHSPNTIWKPQFLRKDDFHDVLPAHQAISNTSKHKSFTTSKSFYDNYGVLDLSIKSSSEQEKPLDFSTKSNQGGWNEDELTPNNSKKTAQGSNHEDQDFSCFQCDLKFNQLFDLNSHFANQHMNSLYVMADDNISTFESKDHLSYLAQSSTTNGTENINCVICGFSERREWQMFNHFESEHYGIEPNPYKSSNITYSVAKHASPSSPQSPIDSSGTPSISCQSLNAEILKNFGFPENGVLDFESQGTAIVIPKAPEETALHARNAPNKHKSQEIAIFPEENSAFLISDSLEESTSTSEGVRATFAGKSGRGKKENSLCNGDVVLPYECKLCGYRARWPSEMTQHMKNHSDEKPYQCPQCSYRSKWKWDVVKHLKRCGGNKDQVESSQKRKRTFPKAFPEISSSDSTNDGFSSIKTSNSDSSQNQREVLSKGPPNITLYANDRPKKKCYEGNTSPRSDKTDNETTSYSASDHHSNLHPCDQCYFVGHSPAELKRHLRVHSDEKPYSCNTCNYSSKWKCDLKKHLRTYNHVPAVPMDQGTSRKTLDGQNVYEASAVSQEKNTILSGEVFFEGRLKCKECTYEATNMMAFVEHVNKHTTISVGNSGQISDENTELLENSRVNYKLNKIKLMSSLGLHQISSDESSQPDAEMFDYNTTDRNNTNQFEDHSTELEEKCTNEIINYTFENSKMHVDYLKNDKMKVKVEDNKILNCSAQLGSSFNNSKSQDDSSSSPKVSSKLFKLQELTINNVRVRLIVKSDKHFYGCIKCPYVSLSSFRTVYHTRQHGSRKNFKCSFCDYSNNQLTFIHKHTAALHGEENNNNFGKLSNPSLKKLNHFRIFQRMNFNLRNVCITCGYASLRRAAIVKHRLTKPCSQLLIKHPMHQHAGDVFSCNKCSFKTDEQLDVVNHSKGHGSFLKHKCLKCDFSSNLMNVILMHKRHQHGSSGR